MNHRHVSLGIVCALIAAIGFSVKSIFIKLAFAQGVDAVTLLALRMGFALPFFIGMAWWDSRRKHATNARSKLVSRDWLVITALSAAYYLFNYLDFLGLQFISAGLERMIQFLYPTMTVLLSAWLYKRALRKPVMWALLLSYAGISLVFMHDISIADISVNGIATLSNIVLTSSQANIGLGAILVFISALSYAIYLVGAGHEVNRIGATRFTAYVMIIASLASLIQFGLMQVNLAHFNLAQLGSSMPIGSLSQPLKVYQLALAMAIFSTVLPVFMLVVAMRCIGSANSSLLGSAGPIFTIYLAHIFLQEQLSALQLLGSLLVLLGVILIGRSSQQKPQAAIE